MTTYHGELLCLFYVQYSLSGFLLNFILFIHSQKKNNFKHKNEDFNILLICDV